MPFGFRNQNIIEVPNKLFAQVYNWEVRISSGKHVANLSKYVTTLRYLCLKEFTRIHLKEKIENIIIYID